ncbi:uracil-DNA glycosylase [Haploplasma axanthum]|uniref:Uracil-DNA glycosylase n=1 Tax=Haploplasma axanthum TaxID=29552 RepID=A0A449BCU7_HAPAX|nr:uracil-DNA glycosylase [Haploplasma axanthum]VEU80248.1 uracil-DNA glycosylase [Haploplasma axanthum]
MWNEIITNESIKEYYKKLIQKVSEERKTKTIYPTTENVFKAFELTPFEKIKVVILGQDPYHGELQAHGLAFSSLDKKTPKSLLNIKKEIKDDLGLEITQNNDLTNWAKQGVLLLNTILTVEEGKPLSHKNFGWEEFTLNIFKEICRIDSPLVFILWGNNAKEYQRYIYNDKHLVLTSVHPSPLSANRGFFGSKPFSKTNKYLQKNNIGVIDFKI